VNPSPLETGGGASSKPRLLQFYDSDDFLVGAVTGFLTAGLCGEEPMLLVVSQPRRELFLARLTASGIDVPTALDEGSLAVLDAEQALEQVMVGALPDPARFTRCLGGKIAELLAHRPGSRVRVYAEMVDALWAKDQGAAAVKLEYLWGELQQRQRITMFRAYVMSEGRDAAMGMAPGPRPEEIAKALRAALTQQRLAESALRASEQQLKAVTDGLPALVAYVDREHRYQLVNHTYQSWFGVETASLVGRHASELLDAGSYAKVAEKLNEALSGQTVEFETQMLDSKGATRRVEVKLTPHRGEAGETIGVVSLVSDVSEQARLREAAEKAQHTTERLLKITAAVAEAVTPEQVYEAVVDQVAEATGASTGALWLLGEGSRTANLVRSWAYSEDKLRQYQQLGLDAAVRFPANDSLRDGQPLWFPDVEALLTSYPHMRDTISAAPHTQVASIPLTAGGRTVGALGFSFSVPMHADEHWPFITLVARASSQALERLELLAAEKRHRAQAELLFGIAQSVIRTERLEDLFAMTLEAICRALGASRSAVLLYDTAGMMRFRAHRGLSEQYRRAVEGHSPWASDATDPKVVWVADAAKEPSLSAHRELLAREHIGALGFLPLVATGRLLGKLMVYYEQPRTLAPHERELSVAISNHIAAAAARLTALDELKETLRFNEMFTGVLGHDLRNPLAAIVTSAQMLLKRGGEEKQLRPLTRVIRSGERMARMIDQLLDFTQVRVGHGIALHATRVDVRQVVDEVIAELADAGRTSRITVEHTGDTTGRWDRDRLVQVFSNLIGNAARHGATDGEVRVSLDGTPERVLHATVRNAGAMPPERVAMLFDPLTGSGRPGGEKSEGLGLGLFISKQIALAHGGTLTVDSNDATGTVFQVSLPRAP
jgi:PAS domain S-box-containing protein